MKPNWILFLIALTLTSSVVYAQTGSAFNQLSSQSKLEALRIYHSRGNTEVPAKPGGHGKLALASITSAPNPCPGVATPQPPMAQDIAAYLNPFAATLDVLASFGDTGANGIPSAQNTIQTEALGQVQFESPHFGFNWAKCSNLSIAHRPTFSFGGTVGLVPALVLENLSTSSTTPLANPNKRPMFQDAFGWSLVPRMNVATSHFSQFDLFGTLGENYILSQVTSFKQGDNTITATPVSNGVGQSALYAETGVQFKYLSTDIINAYSNGADVLDPPFDISVGYRRDGRFNGVGDLSGLRGPENYFFLRFSVGLNKIANWASTQVLPGKGYTFKFGIDYERPISDSSMPTSTRYYVSANIDVGSIFKPSAPPSSGAPPTITSLSKNGGKAGDMITITGTNFGTTFGTVTFGGTIASPTNWGPTSINVAVPMGLTAGTPISVVVAVNQQQSSGVQFTPQ